MAKVTPEFAEAVGGQDTLRQNCTKGRWNSSLNAADEDHGDINEEVREDEDELHGVCWRRARTSNGKESSARNQN